MIAPPAKPIRRLVIAPGLVIGVLLVAVTLPLIMLIAAFASRYVPGKWRIFRIVWFLFMYLLVEAAALTMMFSLWLMSGFGLKLKTKTFIDTHYALLAWMLRRVVASAKFTFKLNVVSEGERPRTVGDAPRPILVFSRHAGPGDSMLLMDALSNQFKRRPRIVMKEFLQWDPAIDVMLNRLPSAFVGGSRDSRDAVVEAIEDISSSMRTTDAFVIFPEGANYTETRYRRSIEKLKEMGRPDLAERAEELENTLPPRSKGVMTALAAAPDNSDVFFIGHAGLETFVTPGDIWRGIPTDTNIAVKVWHYTPDQVPPADEQERWLFDVWAEIDDWITLRLADTEEPFDDPDHY